MKTLVIALTFLGMLTSNKLLASELNCSGVNSWAVNMSFVHLKNAGITNNEALDFTKTKITKIASEEIGKDLYHQVHLITFIEKSGRAIKVISVNDASSKECSMSGVEVFLIERSMGP